MKKRMNLLQIKRLSVNSITLAFLLLAKVRQTFLKLFIGSSRVLDCSESSFVTFTVSFKTLRYFSSGPTPLCSSTHLLGALLLNLGLLEVILLQQYVLLHRHNNSVHLNSSLKRPGSLLSCFLCFTQHVGGKIFTTASALKLSTRSFDQNLCHSALSSGLIQSSSSLSAREKYNESVSNSNFPDLFTSQSLVKRFQYSSKIRSFAY